MFWNCIDEVKQIRLQEAKDDKYRSDKMPLVMVNDVDEMGTFPK